MVNAPLGAEAKVLTCQEHSQGPSVVFRNTLTDSSPKPPGWKHHGKDECSPGRKCWRQFLKKKKK